MSPGKIAFVMATATIERDALLADLTDAEIDRLVEAIVTATATKQCEPMPAVTADGWCEWIHPLPGYLMQCCDCNLIHEMQVCIGATNENCPAFNEGESAKGGVVLFRMRRA